MARTPTVCGFGRDSDDDFPTTGDDMPDELPPIDRDG
jgi:hypothetical protein